MESAGRRSCSGGLRAPPHLRCTRVVPGRRAHGFSAFAQDHSDASMRGAGRGASPLWASGGRQNPPRVAPRAALVGAPIRRTHPVRHARARPQEATFVLVGASPAAAAVVLVQLRARERTRGRERERAGARENARAREKGGEGGREGGRGRGRGRAAHGSDRLATRCRRPGTALIWRRSEPPMAESVPMLLPPRRSSQPPPPPSHSPTLLAHRPTGRTRSFSNPPPIYSLMPKACPPPLPSRARSAHDRKGGGHAPTADASACPRRCSAAAPGASARTDRHSDGRMKGRTDRQKHNHLRRLGQQLSALLSDNQTARQPSRNTRSYWPSRLRLGNGASRRGESGSSPPLRSLVRSTTDLTDQRTDLSHQI